MVSTYQTEIVRLISQKVSALNLLGQEETNKQTKKHLSIRLLRPRGRNRSICETVEKKRPTDTNFAATPLSVKLRAMVCIMHASLRGKSLSLYVHA